MATGKTTTDTGGTSLSPSTVVMAGIVLASVGVAAGLARWSQWWPHGDMRQIWANGLTGLSGLVGLIMLLVVLRRLDGRQRWLLLVLVVVAALVGLVGGFELLRSATVDLR